MGMLQTNTTAANPIISSDIILSIFRGFRGRAWRFFNRARERGTQLRMTMSPGGFVISTVSTLQASLALLHLEGLVHDDCGMTRPGGFPRRGVVASSNMETARRYFDRVGVAIAAGARHREAAAPNQLLEAGV